MKKSIASLACLALAAICPAQDAAVPRMLSTELSAEDVLNGKYPFPPSPEVKFTTDLEDRKSTRLNSSHT